MINSHHFQVFFHRGPGLFLCVAPRVDIFYESIAYVYRGPQEKDRLKNIKFSTKNTHGTGCTLSSAIATFFGCGKTLKKSCEMGIKYVNQAIKTGPNFGKGYGPINHLNSIIINRKFR